MNSAQPNETEPRLHIAQISQIRRRPVPMSDSGIVVGAFLILNLLAGCGLSDLNFKANRNTDLPLPYTYSYKTNAEADLNGVTGDGKDLFVIGDFGQMLVSEDGGIHWSESGVTGSELLSVCDGSGFEAATGRSGTVLFSNDHGGSWTARGPNTTSGLFSCYINGNTIYTAGDNGVIFRSNNMGKAWMPIPSPNVHTTIRWITSSDKRGLLILGTESGEIFAGDTKGSSWNKVWSVSGAVNAISHDDDQTVFIAVGANGMVARSIDGGQSWSSVKTPYTRTLVEIVYAPATRSFVVVGGGGFMASSVDGGVSWSRVLLPLNRAIRGLYISPKDEIVAVGQKGTVLIGNQGGMQLIRGSPYDFKGIVTTASRGMFLYGAGGIIRHSLDLGLSWHNEILGTDSTINFITECSGSLWAVGDHGLIAMSKDGEVWETQTHSPDVSLNGIACSNDAQHVFIVGGQGTVERSQDKGVTWTTTVPGSHDDLNTVALLNNLVVVAGNNGSILTTDIRASKWSDASQDPIYNFTSLQIGPTGEDVWAFGTNGAVFFSHNAGRDWDYDDNSVSDDLHSSLCLRRCSNVVAVGDNGTVVIRGSSDENWSYTTKTRYPLYSIASGKDDVIYALGSDSTIYQPKSVNGTWQSTELGAVLGAFVTKDGRHIWAAGSKGIIWESQDGGIQWRAHATGLQKALNAIAGDDLGVDLVAVSDQGYCVRSTDQGVTWKSDRIAKVDLNGASWIGNTFWATGDRGTILKFDPSTQAWLTAATVNAVSLNAIAGTRDGKRLWVVGAAGTIAQSIDAGKSWSTQTIADTTLNAIVVDENAPTQVTAVGDSGLIAFSRDEGKTWEVNARGGSHLYAVTSSPRTRQLIAVGQNGRLLISDDMGEIWNSQTSGTDSDLRGILTVDGGNQLYALGDAGAFEKYAIYSQRFVPEILGLNHTLSQVSVKIKFSGAYVPTKPTFYARARRVTELNRTEPVMIPTRVDPHSEAEDPWNISFDLADLHPTPGEGFDLETCFRSGSYQRCIPLSRITAIPLIDFHKNAKWMVPSGVILASAGVLECLLFIQPLWILALYRKAYIYEALGNSSLPGAKVIKGILQGTLLPWFAFQPRALAAWVKQHQIALSQRVHRDLKSSIAIGSDSPYVSLPIDIQDRNQLKLIPEPSKSTFLPFASRTVILEICGPGGIGKTTLLNQISEWLATPDEARSELYTAGFVAIEAYTGELIPYISKKLRKITEEEDLSDEFTRQLLRKGVLIPVIDSFSELEETMQAKLTEDLEESVIKLVILTSRERAELKSAERVMILPKPLDSRTLLRFITSVLAAASEDIDAFNSMEFQLDLGIRIARIMTTAGTEIPLTPLLAKLYLDRAVELMRTGRSMDELPTSIAETYFEFIRLLLRREPALDQVTALACIKKMGKMTLGRRFVPSKVGLVEVLAEFRSIVADRGISVIRTLVAAGVLKEEELGLGKAVSFALDPVAEFCAAYAYTEELGFDLEAWSGFRQQVLADPGAPTGFRVALDLVIRASVRKGICAAEVASWFAP